MQTLSQIKELLAARGLSPRKQFGQNFLVDQNLLAKLADAASLREGDLVLEIGPGTGTLTEALLARGCRVIAAEIDRGLADFLREHFRAAPAGAFELVEGDCLEGKHALAPALADAIRKGLVGATDAGRGFSLVANLPYACATPIMMILLASWPACSGLFVTVQREVADRVLAGPGVKDYGPLSVLAHLSAQTRRVATLPPACFWPRPDVTSAMIAIQRRPVPLHPEPARVLDFCQRLFGFRRKQLGSALAAMGVDGANVVLPASVTLTARAESCTPEQLAALADAVQLVDARPAKDRGHEGQRLSGA